LRAAIAEDVDLKLHLQTNSATRKTYAGSETTIFFVGLLTRVYTHMPGLLASALDMLASDLDYTNNES
jgi:hypothetical protein